MPTMLSGRLFQILTARWMRLLPEEQSFLISALPGHGFAYSGSRGLLVLGGRDGEAWFSGAHWYASCTGLAVSAAK